VVVIGPINGILLYRELMRRGVSEYLIAPAAPLQLSSICHNVAWSISEHVDTKVTIADLDLPFGTAALNFNHDPVQSIPDVLTSPGRRDELCSIGSLRSTPSG
jgi:pilus assembly protein CpaE